jgi:hypothetical protein
VGLFSNDDKEPPVPGEAPKVSMTRIAVWIVVAGAGAWMIISGLVGMVAKGG